MANRPEGVFFNTNKTQPTITILPDSRYYTDLEDNFDGKLFKFDKDEYNVYIWSHDYGDYLYILRNDKIVRTDSQETVDIILKLKDFGVEIINHDDYEIEISFEGSTYCFEV